MANQDRNATAAPTAVPLRKTSGKARPRAERSPPPGAFAELLAELRLLGQRTGEALVGAYVSVASGVLTEVERLEDLSAERRYRQRTAQAARAQKTKQALPPVKGD